MNAIAKYEPPRNLAQEWIDRQWMTFLTRNADPRPMPGSNAYYIGPVEDAPAEIHIERWCPYAPGRVRRDAGASLLELCVVVCIILAVAGIGIPALWSAFQSVRHWMNLASQVVVR